VFDLETRAWDEQFAELVLRAQKPAWDGTEVVFDSAHQLQRSAVIGVQRPDLEVGLAYVSLGNGPSTQPFHGWVFEIDLDKWQQDSLQAISGVLLTTPDNECSPSGSFSNAMVCGGGVWTPSGPLLVGDPASDYEIIVPTGNGRVDFSRGDYAHGLLRVRQGLAFDPACDGPCANFDPLSPDPRCLESCRDLFVPRLLPDDEPLAPENGVCDGLSFFECYGELDADLGASAPALVRFQDFQLLAQPGKDGAVYLVDLDHLGRMYDRKVAIDFCGTPADKCKAHWAGSFVTQPVVADVDGVPVVITPGFKFDETHPAGIVAYSVMLEAGEPRLQLRWQVPSFESNEAVQRFRVHPGRPALSRFGAESYVWVVEVGRAPIVGPGLLWGVRVRDGANLVREPLRSEGMRYVKPLVVDDMLYVASCSGNATVNGTIEAFRVRGGTAEVVELTDAGAATAEACEPSGTPCTSDEYCERAAGDDCARPGACRLRPSTCEPMSDRVCGCDGRVYDNACEAARAGQSVAPRLAFCP
jgi:hypothetical protein